MDRSWARGEGHRLYDTAGRGYLDFANGIAVTALGHAHPRVTAAIHQQVDRLMGPVHAMGFAEPTVRLAAALSATFPQPLDTVFFLNSGSEAIDGVAEARTPRDRTAGDDRVPRRVPRPDVGRDERDHLEHQLPHRLRADGARRVLRALPSAYDFGGDEQAATDAALAILRSMFTTVDRGVAGSRDPHRARAGRGRVLSRPAGVPASTPRPVHEHGILLIADEVQSGYGRTGKMWAFEHAGIVPDVVAVAKAIANGLPLSAVVTRRELQERWGRGAHGSTYGGNPVACAAGLAVLETIREEDLVANAAARGRELTAGLRELMAEDPGIGDVRGPGLMIGVEFVTDRGTRAPDGARADAVAARAAEEGVLLLTCGLHHQVIRWIPPLDVTVPEIEEGLAVFERALKG